MVAAAAAMFAVLVDAAAGQQFSDADFCRAMRDIAEKGNLDAGSKVDAVTTHLGVAVLGASKFVDFKKQIAVPLDVFREGWTDRKQMQWNQIYCSNPAFAVAIAAGWRIASTITDIEGRRHYMEATCR